MMLFLCPGIVRVGGAGSSGLPRFTYTGTYTLIDDGNRNWRIKFLTSGTLVFTGAGTITLDVFCVGGGGKATPAYSDLGTGMGGAGGLTATQLSCAVTKGQAYSLIVGAGASTNGTGVRGGTSSAFNLSALGGQSGNYGNNADGGSGGSDRGWAGGVNGGNGGSDYPSGWGYGYGQGTTTREFAETTGALYSNGGCGSGHASAAQLPRANSGDGSNAYVSAQANGADGIVVIRNHRAA